MAVMTWGEFKERLTKLGVTDEMVIDYIDIFYLTSGDDPEVNTEDGRLKVVC